jgi:hypothetical protein
MSITHTDTACATPSIASTMMDSVRESSAIQDVARTKHDLDQVLNDMQLHHTNFTHELQQTQKKLCTELQEKYEDLVASLQREVSQHTNTTNQYQTKCEEISKSFQDSLKEALSAHEEKISSLITSRLDLAIEPWLSTAVSNPMFVNAIESRVSQVLASHYAQMESKYQVLERKLSSWTDTESRARKEDIPVLDAPIQADISVSQHDSKAQLLEQLPLEEKENRKKEESSRDILRCSEHVRPVHLPTKVSSRCISAKSTVESPSNGFNDTKKGSIKRSRGYPKNKDVKKGIVSNKRTAKLITPLVSQDPIRKRPLEEPRTLLTELGPSPKVIFPSTVDHWIPDTICSTDSCHPPPSTFYNRRRNKEKVYGKKLNSFDVDPYDFL